MTDFDSDGIRHLVRAWTRPVCLVCFQMIPAKGSLKPGSKGKEGTAQRFLNWVRSRPQAIALGIQFLPEISQFFRIQYLLLRRIPFTELGAPSLRVRRHNSVEGSRPVLSPRLLPDTGSKCSKPENEKSKLSIKEIITYSFSFSSGMKLFFLISPATSYSPTPGFVLNSRLGWSGLIGPR